MFLRKYRAQERVLPAAWPNSLGSPGPSVLLGGRGSPQSAAQHRGPPYQSPWSGEAVGRCRFLVVGPIRAASTCPSRLSRACVWAVVCLCGPQPAPRRPVMSHVFPCVCSSGTCVLSWGRVLLVPAVLGLGHAGTEWREHGVCSCGDRWGWGEHFLPGCRLPSHF